MKLAGIARQEAKLLSHVHKLLSTVNNTTSGEVGGKKCLNSGITLFLYKIATSHKHSPMGSTRALIVLHEARLHHVVWLREPE